MTQPASAPPPLRDAGADEHGADADEPLSAFRGDHPVLGSRGSTLSELALVTILAMAVLLPGLSSYSLVDPWETHYAEVARRMLQDHDYVHTKWQDEGFRSKPVLSFWLIAASLRGVGLAESGGFSGEMTSTPLVMFAVRLPFALFGVFGLVMIFWMLSRLVSRRVAWLAFLITATTPFYFMVARQAITDIPMVACLMGALACFALAVHSRDAPVRRLWSIRGRAVDGRHLFAAALIAFVGGQLVYYAYYFFAQPGLGPGVRFPAPGVIIPGAMLAGLVGFLVWAHVLQPTRYARQVYMYWFYTLLAVSVLGKGLPGIGLAGLVCFAYLLLTGHWRLLAKVELPRGILLCLLIVVPWHMCMILKDGRPFLREYFITHLWRRAAVGVHGERGTFDFFISQLGIGMWPWVGLLPAAVAGVLGHGTGRTRAGSVRLLVGIWAIVTVAFFSAVQTKFHHYILPAVPALAILIAFWVDDLLDGRIKHVAITTLAGAAIVLLIMRDLIGEHEQLIEMYIYRYDRPWPSGAPWYIDASDAFLGVGIGSALLLAAVGLPRLRRIALTVFGALAIGYALWCMHVYMHHAGTHWGMREAARTYYQSRQIQGIDIRYYGSRQLAAEWADQDGPYPIDTVIPEHLSVGQPMTVHLEVSDQSGAVQESVDLTGVVDRIGDNRFWVALDIHALADPAAASELTPAERTAAEAQQRALTALIDKGRGAPRPYLRPVRQVRADRLIAWQLYWRGENFWSSDEIWGPFDDTKTAYKDTDNKAFLEYLNGPGRKDRRYYVLTEAGRAKGLKNILPTPRAKETFEIIDTSSNKFTLLSFEL
ncbi:ArnT family glycosyltransferase [Haliangium sp.]|uniref:ArnT family glycosyltransferase n=1 Tax=Haliangium sp. TaxID=2663208 RepID=UPI003D14C9A0